MLKNASRKKFIYFISALCSLWVPTSCFAAMPPLDFTVNMSENVVVDTSGGVPSIGINVGGISRTAVYVSGSGTNNLVFRYTPTQGDIDLDGIAISSPVVLNGGSISDNSGNNATLTFTSPNTANVKVNYPSLSMDLVYDADGRYTLGGTTYNSLGPFLSATGGAFTRASIGTYYDSGGVMRTAASGQPRFDYDPATLQPKVL